MATQFMKFSNDTSSIEIQASTGNGCKIVTSTLRDNTIYKGDVFFYEEDLKEFRKWINIQLREIRKKNAESTPLPKKKTA